jgi:hypothetical protein
MMSSSSSLRPSPCSIVSTPERSACLPDAFAAHGVRRDFVAEAVSIVHQRALPHR